MARDESAMAPTAAAVPATKVRRLTIMFILPVPGADMPLVAVLCRPERRIDQPRVRQAFPSHHCQLVNRPARMTKVLARSAAPGLCSPVGLLGKARGGIASDARRPRYAWAVHCRRRGD